MADKIPVGSIVTFFTRKRNAKAEAHEALVVQERPDGSLVLACTEDLYVRKPSSVKVVRAAKADDAVYFRLTCCDQCTHCNQSRYYTADSFENVVAWNCRHPRHKDKKNGSTDREEWRSPPGIALQEPFDKPPPIPTWCPLRKGK